MLMKHEFQQTCARLGLEDHELDLAEIIWSKCEHAFQGGSVQDAALLTKPQVRIRVNQETLTRQDMQYLSNVLSKALTQGENFKQSAKRSADALWRKCDKNDPETAEYFSQLNRLRNFQRNMKRAFNKLAVIQSKLKRSLGE